MHSNEEIRNYYYLSVIGYGGTVGPAFGGSLVGRTMISISEVAEMPARLEDRNKKVSDGAGGVTIYRPSAAPRDIIKALVVVGELPGFVIANSRQTSS